MIKLPINVLVRATIVDARNENTIIHRVESENSYVYFKALLMYIRRARFTRNIEITDIFIITLIL